MIKAKGSIAALESMPLSPSIGGSVVVRTQKVHISKNAKIYAEMLTPHDAISGNAHSRITAVAVLQLSRIF